VLKKLLPLIRSGLPGAQYIESMLTNYSENLPSSILEINQYLAGLQNVIEKIVIEKSLKE